MDCHFPQKEPIAVHNPKREDVFGAFPFPAHREDCSRLHQIFYSKKNEDAIRYHSENQHLHYSVLHLLWLQTKRQAKYLLPPNGHFSTF